MKTLLTFCFYFFLSSWVLGQETHVIPSGGAKLHVKLYPRACSETIIFLHGGPGAPAEFSDEINYVKDHYQVINLDQRGAGSSTCEGCEYSMDEYTDDILTIMDYFDLEKVHLFGHSWGGLYAQLFMEKYPEKVSSVFVSSPSSGTGDQWSEMRQEVMLYNKEKCTPKEWRRMGVNSLLSGLGSDRAMGRLYAQVVKNYNKGHVEVDELDVKSVSFEKAKGKSTHKTVTNIKNAEPLRGLENPEFPILISYGDDDIYGETNQYVIERYPTAEVVVIPNCGHPPTVHNPEFYWGLFNRFYNLPGDSIAEKTK